MRWIRVLLVALVALLVFLQMRLWFGEGGSRSVADLQQKVEAQARENGGLKQRNDALAAEVEDLKSGEAAVEDRARSELGMIKPGETFYRVVEPQGAGAASDGGADDSGAPADVAGESGSDGEGRPAP
ncbi:cell division protein FtsB [Aerolutibacter ruishenii]|uniref:Cell division protein FtsB n=1 Tax=Aerolutibacter ruishenii TaxID=686800 RepID=A0A562LKY9_9GAMM|nr:cell division protein FtsB [Lysobacter ruishenii]TWI08253.1 cell division protein FtsB [Lysobacter ruishenii]